MWLVALALAADPDLAALDAAVARARAVAVEIPDAPKPADPREEALARSRAVHEGLARREAAVAKVETLAATMSPSPEVALRVARAHADLLVAMPTSRDDFTAMALEDVAYPHEERIRAVLASVPPSLDGQRLLQDRIDHPERQSFPRCVDEERTTREAIPSLAAKVAHLEADVHALAGCADVAAATRVLEQAREVVAARDESRVADMTTFVDPALVGTDAALAACGVDHPSVPPVPPVAIHDETVCVAEPWRTEALARFDPLECETADAKDAAALIHVARGWLDASQDLWWPDYGLPPGVFYDRYRRRGRASSTSPSRWAALRADRVLDEARARGGGDEAERVQASVLRWRSRMTMDASRLRVLDETRVSDDAVALLDWMAAHPDAPPDPADRARLALALDVEIPPAGVPPDVGLLVADAARRASRRLDVTGLDPTSALGIRLRAWALWAGPAPAEPEGLATERDRVRADLARPERCRDPAASAEAAAILAGPQDDLQAIRLLIVHPRLAAEGRRCPAPVGPWSPPPAPPFLAEPTPKLDTLFDTAPDEPRARAIAVARGAERAIRAGDRDHEVTGPAIALMAWALAEIDGTLGIGVPPDRP